MPIIILERLHRQNYLLSLLAKIVDTSQLEEAKNVLLQKKDIALSGTSGSGGSLILAALTKKLTMPGLFVASDKEEALFLYNDLKTFLGDANMVFLPLVNSANAQQQEALMRTETLTKIANAQVKNVITYTEAFAAKVVGQNVIGQNTLLIEHNKGLEMDLVLEELDHLGFEYDDFVYEPGQYAIRGGIIDVFSFAHDLPARIVFSDKTVESIQLFNPDNQLSMDTIKTYKIVPNLSHTKSKEFLPITALFDISPTLFLQDGDAIHSYIGEVVQNIPENSEQSQTLSSTEWQNILNDYSIVHFGKKWPANAHKVTFQQSPQPTFNKNFDLIVSHIKQNAESHIHTCFVSDQDKQLERLKSIFEDLKLHEKITDTSTWTDNQLPYLFQNASLHAGFTDDTLNVAVFTDHQIFDRFKRYPFKTTYNKSQALTLKTLSALNPGDYVTHIEHGIGRFAGLESIDVNGNMQEVAKLIFKDNDSIYVSIHALHRITKYANKDVPAPKLNKLGSGAWKKLKQKTKTKVKSLAFDLIKLYAKRRQEKGFAYSPDSYMQQELEASFIFEDTPDQATATDAVKADMEKHYPMDRLICGDVGFGKTEIAIRAAFKAAANGKQIAILVPTTILALQHYKTFSERLRNFPVQIDYINRFKPVTKQKATLQNLISGQLDIVIGTHRLISKDVKFKDLGLLIVDEEQKFGVGVKDKLKALKASVDTLTLSATPIPRTLQFSLLGARDFSIIRTPPPNRYPIITSLIGFNTDAIKQAINDELSRNGQVYFVHNKIQNLAEVQALIQKLCPKAKVVSAHGQMKGTEMESKMLAFIEGDYDVLVATSIVENGLDIPNANTIIINHAQNFGLSDLHQMRGRVGRSNKKAYCYLITPPTSAISSVAKKRLEALVEYSNLGAGFNIAMKDLDIRGAGNLLGAEQSGFINEMGYITYQQILNEALQELKENEFSHIFKEELAKKGRFWVQDTQLDTDLALHIPPNYVNQITERLSLYKAIDNLETEEAIREFSKNLQDRFGKIPWSVVELLNGVRLRQLAKSIGMEKIILKKNVMLAYFVSNAKSPFYQSEIFVTLMQALSKQKTIEVKQKQHKLYLYIPNIKSMEVALKTINELLIV